MGFADTRLRSCAVSALLLLPTAGAEAQTAPAPDSTVQFETADGVTVWGDLYLTDAPRSAPVILLFHQGGGDARGEYGPLVGTLLGRGFHAFSIDQRRGGSRLGGANRTVAALEGESFAYCDAYADLEAALSYVGEWGLAGKRIVWGSSYSAALALKLAAEHSAEIGAVLAFSPASGEPMAGCEPAAFVERLTVPALVLRPASEMGIESVRAQLEYFAAAGLETYVSNPGVHGSSMLNPTRVGAPTDDTWAVVLEFIQRATR